MRAETRRVDDITIVDLRGDLVLGDGDEVLHEVFDTLLTEGHEKILLNLSQVDRMDSTGIGELVSGWKQAKRHGHSVRLVRLGDRVKHALHLSQLLPLIEVYESEKDALEHFRTA